MSALNFALAALVMTAGAMLQGSIGFGLNVVAAPLLVLIDTRLVPGPALAAAFALTILIGVRDRGGVDFEGFWWLFCGRLPASVGAALLVGLLPERGVAVALAGTVLAAVAMSTVGWRPRRTRRMLLGAGAASGVMGTLSSVGGPPVAMLYQDARGSQLRGTLSAIFSVGALTSILLLGAVGRFGSREVTASLVLLPGVVVGFVLSRWTARVVDRGRVRPFVLAFSAAASIAALVRYAI